MKKLYLILVILLFLIMLTAGGCSNNKENDSNSRTNPAHLNEIVIIGKEDFIVGNMTYEVELMELITGGDAWDEVKTANQFNDEPSENKEYILAKFRFKIISGAKEKAYKLNHTIFSAVSSTEAEYSEFISVAGLNPNFTAELNEGAEHIGWTYFMVDIDDEAPLAVIDRTRESEVWFALRP